MSSEYREISLKDAVEFIVDNRGKTAPTEESGIALIATNCVNNKDLYPQKINIRYVSKDTYDNWFRSHPKPSDILLTNKGSQNGAVCLVPDPVDFCIAQDMVALRADAKKISPLYLFAALRSELVQNRMKALNVDAVIPHLKKTDFDKLFIPLPDALTQRLVGEFYFQISSRIELLKETNATLEAIAQALFKSWFVDFDPVHANAHTRAQHQNSHPQAAQPNPAPHTAKANAQNLGLDAATAALFPDHFQDSDLGPIPAGWRVESLDSIADFLNGLALQKFPPREDSWLPVIKIAQLKKGDTVGADRASKDLKPEYVIKNGDVLFSWSGSLEIAIWCGGEGALNQHLFKVTSESYPKWFYYLWTKHHLPDFQQIAASKATTMGHIQRKHLSEAKVVVPPIEIIDYVGKTISPLLDAWLNNAEQAQTLTQLRDTLLPRLISGQLRLPDAEAQVEAVVGGA